jgi:hypothetical protein
MHSVAHGAINLQHQRTRLDTLSLHDCGQCLALGLVGPFVDDQLHRPIAVMNSSGPSISYHHKQPIQTGFTKMPFIDAKARHRFASAVSRWRHELARAAVIAIAVDEMRSLNTPINGRHVFLLSTIVELI